MATDLYAIYSKTSKGVLAVKNKTVKLSRGFEKVFLAIDGKSKVNELAARLNLEPNDIVAAIEKLLTDDLIKVFQSSIPTLSPNPGATNNTAAASGGDDLLDELDFTSAEAVSQLNSEAEARAKAEAQARAQALALAHAAAQAKARQLAEAKARVLAEHKRKLEAQARAQAEALARAQAEAQARAEAEARAAANAKAKAEAEVRVKAAIAAKMKAEAEAKARAEAEAEAAAEEQVKAEAEARAQAEAEAQTNAEAVAKAQADAEARILNAVEEKLRVMQEALQEAQTRAKQETEARAKAETEAQARAQVEAQARAAAQARARAAEEAAAKAKAEAEATTEKAKQDGGDPLETDARIQAALRRARAAEDVAAQAMVEAEQRAREEAERREQEEIARLQFEAELQIAREEAEAKARNQLRVIQESIRKTQLESERRAHEAEARATAVEQAHQAAMARIQEEAVTRVKMEQKIRAEQQARAAAEDRAKQEAVARVIQEQQIREQAEKSLEAKIQAEIKARQQAEFEAEVQEREEAAKRAAETAKRVSAEQAAYARGVAAAPRPKRRRKSSNNPIQTLLIGVVMLVVLAIIAIPFIPISGYVPTAEKTLSDKFGQPVLISTIHLQWRPAPEVVFEHVTIGQLQNINIDSAELPIGSALSLLSKNKIIGSVTLNKVNIDQIGLSWLPAFAGAQTDSTLKIQRISARGVKLGGLTPDVPAFDANVSLTNNGVKKVFLQNGTTTITLTTADDGIHAEFKAKEWTSPIGPAFEFSALEGDAVINGNQITGEITDAHLYEGAATGSFALTWDTPLQLQGKLEFQHGNLESLLAVFTSNFSASGTIDELNLNFSAQAPTLNALLDAPSTSGSFSVHSGALKNVDIVRASQSAGKTSGGRTEFQTFAGELQISGGQMSYRNLQLISSSVNAVGNVEVSPSSALSGHTSVRVGSQSIVVARGTLVIDGSTDNPTLHP